MTQGKSWCCYRKISLSADVPPAALGCPSWETGNQLMAHRSFTSWIPLLYYLHFKLKRGLLFQVRDLSLGTSSLTRYLASLWVNTVYSRCRGFFGNDYGSYQEIFLFSNDLPTCNTEITLTWLTNQSTSEYHMHIFSSRRVFVNAGSKLWVRN